MSLTIAGLFAGVGGVELGLHAAGHQTRLLCEIDEAAPLWGRGHGYRPARWAIGGLRDGVALQLARVRKTHHPSRQGRLSARRKNRSGLGGDGLRYPFERRVARDLFRSKVFERAE